MSAKFPSEFGHALAAAIVAQGHVSILLENASRDKDFVRALAETHGATHIAIAHGLCAGLNRKNIRLQLDDSDCRIDVHLHRTGRCYRDIFSLHIPKKALADEKSFARWRKTETKRLETLAVRSFVENFIKFREIQNRFYKLPQRDRDLVRNEVMKHDRLTLTAKTGGAS